jgi:hypothetical protein
MAFPSDVLCIPVKVRSHRSATLATSAAVAVPYFFASSSGHPGFGQASAQKNPARLRGRTGPIQTPCDALQDAAALGARFREFRWKNSAWLATAETIAGWNGFEIRNAGSGRSPVRKRSG